MLPRGPRWSPEVPKRSPGFHVIECCLWHVRGTNIAEHKQKNLIYIYIYIHGRVLLRVVLPGRAQNTYASKVRPQTYQIGSAGQWIGWTGCRGGGPPPKAKQAQAQAHTPQHRQKRCGWSNGTFLLLPGLVSAATHFVVKAHFCFATDSARTRGNKVPGADGFGTCEAHENLGSGSGASAGSTALRMSLPIFQF